MGSKNTIMAGPGTSVITAHELARMKVSIDEGQGIMPPANPHELRSERVRLQKISQDRVSRWPNTLEAERKKKEARRQQRHDEEEVQRKKIDKEEAVIQGEKRRMAIERANKMLYDDNDRVKSFHSALLLSDVMKEREAQIEVTRQRTKNERRRDKHWAMMQDEAIEEYDRKEIDKKTEVQRKRYEVAVARESQLADLKKVIADGKKDKEREGQLIIQKAQMEIAKARREEQARVEEEAERGWVRQRNVDVTNFNIQLREEKKMERQILRQTSLEAASRASEILGEEDARFDQYATACMNEWHQGGKTCKPMRILLGKGESVTE